MEARVRELLNAQPIPLSFYERETIVVARDLLGTFLVRQAGDTVQIGRIVETEAYLGVHDKASHSSRGRTPRTRTMFGPPGHAYVYLVYGMHCCLNAVTEPEGNACAVLIRAVDPVHGIASRCDGPGRLCRVLGIDRGLNGQPLTSPALWIAPRLPGPVPRIVRRPRVGVDYAGAWARRLLRFMVREQAPPSAGKGRGRRPAPHPTSRPGRNRGGTQSTEA